MFDLPLTRVKDEVKVITIFDFAFDRDQMCNKSYFSCRDGVVHGPRTMFCIRPREHVHLTLSEELERTQAAKQIGSK